jgi:hypothetical protein
MPELTFREQQAVKEVIRDAYRRGTAKVLNIAAKTVQIVKARIKGSVGQEIAAVMHRHQKEAHPDGPHDAYYHPERMAVYHHHHKDAPHHHLVACKRDLAALPGVEQVGQGTDAPPDRSGFEKVYAAPPPAGDAATAAEPPAVADMGEEKEFFGLWQIARRRRTIYKSLDGFTPPAATATAAEVLGRARLR